MKKNIKTNRGSSVQSTENNNHGGIFNLLKEIFAEELKNYSFKGLR
jgi:hypothetical protein